MAFVAIPNDSNWEYDNAPADPGIGSPLRDLWLLQTNGIRTDSGGHKVYVSCRKVGETIERGELSKTYIDSRPSFV